MQRVGYDADSQTYTYRDNDGSLWEGEEGNRYGNLHRAGQPAPRPTPVSSRAKNDGWQYMATWMLIVIVAFLALWRFVNWKPAPLDCAEGFENYVIAKGDTCWKIADERSWSVDGLKEVNEGLNCDRLIPGDQLCVHVAA